ncbi:MAG: hypothetical protein HY646_10245 [Acidobacteria bacterium]|nr:hypothetical protein [Acidobacteriota bacterium]
MTRSGQALFFGISIVLCLTTIYARQRASAPSTAQTAATAVNFTAASANVSESGIAVRINILRWSTDQERNPLLAALNPPAPAPAAAGAAEGDRGAAQRGDRGAAAQGGRDGAAGGRGGRGGGGGRGGRGDAAPAGPVDPIVAFTDAIGKSSTVGYVWTNEVVGYSIKYAYRAPLLDGGERIILATDRRLGGSSTAWKPKASATLTDYEFTVIEMRLDSKGLGQAKTSLTTKVILDDDAKTVALDNYAAAPAMLQNVKHQ